MGMSGSLANALPRPADSITNDPRRWSESGPFSSTPKRGRKSLAPGATMTTGPASALGTNGEVAVPVPTIDFGGQAAALTWNWINEQVCASAVLLGPMVLSSSTFAPARPASVWRCWITVLSGVLEPALVAPGAPTVAVRVGE